MKTIILILKRSRKATTPFGISVALRGGRGGGGKAGNGYFLELHMLKCVWLLPLVSCINSFFVGGGGGQKLGMDIF